MQRYEAVQNLALDMENIIKKATETKGGANIIKLKIEATKSYPVSEKDIQRRLDLLVEGCFIEIVGNNAIWIDNTCSKVVDDITKQKPLK